MIKAMPKRILVQVTPIDSSELLEGHETLQKLGIQTVDKKRHYDHASRKGTVVSVGRNVSQEIKIGDTVVFRGDAGFTLDYDPDRNLDESKYRWLKEADCLALDTSGEEVAA